MKRTLIYLLLASVLLLPPTAGHARPDAATYYVSSSQGDDGNDGLSPSDPFETISHVNTLDLQPGDRVLFRCGDTWRTDPLVVDDSGSSSAPITFGAYPEGCTELPVLSGAQPIAGWTAHSTNVYVADLSAGSNAGKFAYGVNQLFRGDARLTLGRWPNLDAGNGGYSTIDGHPSGNQITDNELPSGDWTGAVAHIRGMTWYILNREVTGDSGQTLTLGAEPDCWNGCTGWGYFLNRHLNTLDQEGEWYYDAGAHRVYLYTTGGAPADGAIEGSVILEDDSRSWGGVVLGEDLHDPISYVTVENLDVRRWYRHGIATPTNYAHYESHHVTLRNNVISDVDSTGINLAVWVYSAQDGRASGWRGGYSMTVDGNTIDTANHMGINAYSRSSTFSDNVIRDVGLIENLGAAGMGCSFTASGGVCTEDGDGIRIKVNNASDSGNNNTLSGNRLERIAYNGIDVFGHSNTFEHNVIRLACYAKADCGGVRTFGSSSLSQSPVHDLTFRENLILDTWGNLDGSQAGVGVPGAFGFYIDNYSRNVTLTGNSIISSTVHGVLYQRSTGSMTGNTLYNNSRTAPWSAQVRLGGSPASLGTHRDNVLYSLNSDGWTLAVAGVSRLGTSDDNYFFNPYRTNHIHEDSDYALAGWQSFSGKDANSVEHWFTLAEGDPPRSRILYNDTTGSRRFELGSRQYLDLDQNPVLGAVTLSPFTSLVLVDDGEAPLTLHSMTPSMWGTDEPAAFTLTLYGAHFTQDSVVRWDGSDRPTSLVSPSILTAAISATDVDTVGDVPVTVYDPAVGGGTETAPLTFHVVDSVARLYLPVVSRE